MGFCFILVEIREAILLDNLKIGGLPWVFSGPQSSSLGLRSRVSFARALGGPRLIIAYDDLAPD